jgi:glycolate oxidase
MSDTTIIDLLRERLPTECVLSETEDLRPYECDGLSAYRRLPMVVVIPQTLEQVQTTLKLCAQNAVAVVARGAGTGLSGGALPLSDGVLLSMARFNRILGIDTANRTARVQPGVTNLSHRLPARSAAMLRRMPVACTASSTDSPCTISSSSRC